VGILTYVKLNSMGATLGECSHQLYVLALQGVAYFILATLATLRLLGRLSK
jgi:steroid 5-alpha reductase family enzyme